MGGFYLSGYQKEARDQQREQVQQQQEQAKRDNIARLLEARKPFIAKQLELYIKTATIAGELVSANTDVPRAEWNTSLREFEKLYWTELSMVEDDDVKNAMQDLYGKLLWANAQKEVVADDKWHDLQESSYRLARALRHSIENSWDLNVGKP
jgi:hypothetical protein